MWTQQIEISPVLTLEMVTRRKPAEPRVKLKTFPILGFKLAAIASAETASVNTGLEPNRNAIGNARLQSQKFVAEAGGTVSMRPE